MTCGDSTTAWVPSGLTGSTWSGTMGEKNVTAAFVNLSNVAITVVDTIPTIGEWAHTGVSSFHWTGALEGISYEFQMTADSCDGSGKVTAAHGSAANALDENFQITMSRTL